MSGLFNFLHEKALFILSPLFKWLFFLILLGRNISLEGTCLNLQTIELKLTSTCYRRRTKVEKLISCPSSHRLWAELLKSKTNVPFTKGVLSFVKAFNWEKLSNYALYSRWKEKEKHIQTGKCEADKFCINKICNI